MEHRIALGLGGNVGDAPEAIAEALQQLDARGKIAVKRVSRLYRTKPWGPVPQADYANACALAVTALAPRDLLIEVKAIEALLGREPGIRWGPRRIDIDVLYYEGETVDAPDLVIPHKSLFERAFVLVPLTEIAPDLVIGDRRIADAAASISQEGVTLWEA